MKDEGDVVWLARLNLKVGASEPVENIKFGNVRVFVQLMFGLGWPNNQQKKNPNIYKFEIFYRLLGPYVIKYA